MDRQDTTRNEGIDKAINTSADARPQKRIAAPFGVDANDVSAEDESPAMGIADTASETDEESIAAPQEQVSGDVRKAPAVAMRMVDASGNIVEILTDGTVADPGIQSAERMISAASLPAAITPVRRDPREIEKLKRESRRIERYRTPETQRKKASSKAYAAETALAKPAPKQISRIKENSALPAKKTATTKKKAVDPEKKKKRTRIIAIAAGGTAVLLVAASAALFAAAKIRENSQFVHAKEVYFDGYSMGMVVDGDEMERTVDALYDELSQEYGAEILSNQTFEMVDTIVDQRYITSAGLIGQEVKKNIDVRVSAYVINVAGFSAVALASREDADWVLAETLLPYQGADMFDVQFLEDVEVGEGDVEAGSVKTKEEALSLLTMGVDGALTYEVKSGDTLWSIALDHGLTVAELRTANPELGTSDTINIGMTLDIIKPQNLVNVTSSRKITVTDVIPHTTETRYSDSMYKDQSVVNQAGSDGERVAVIQIDYVNGAESRRTTLSDVVTREAVTEIVTVGTLTRPSNVSASGFMRPISGGRITSRFGYRTSPYVGFHYGIDIGGLSVGTPIYATKSGTVTFAGWSGGYGYMVQIDHGNGVVSRYAHMSRILTYAGARVSQGDTVGQLGSTGNSTGPHLHFEIRINGTAQNPANYVNF